jgi:hypothetical protein
VGTRGEVQRVREIQPVVMPVQRGFDLFPTCHDNVRQPQQVPDDANEIHRLETIEGAQYPLELKQIELVSIDGEISRQYAWIRVQLERRGTPIGANDCWIAAQALALGAVVVTDNQSGFRRVPGLVTENWLSTGS